MNSIQQILPWLQFLIPLFIALLLKCWFLCLSLVGGYALAIYLIFFVSYSGPTEAEGTGFLSIFTVITAFVIGVVLEIIFRNIKNLKGKAEFLRKRHKDYEIFYFV
ncbi:hypothetical protein [Aneurinibacillus uraniidurans]|uniref:hypothetical protein n=1 Tax=Aneurinibacillus uraniidurans TaxID=2966586 RepID=UPI0023493F66|nr:hypothetical protein [Aneurinibacillus sp. B1]WCN39425.1 hypothetical protein PO771_08555 [Aneurinibacillus sp. B1]